MSKQQEALQFLDDLDSLNVPSSSKPAVPVISSGAQPTNEAEALAFLDEITQKSSEPTRTTTMPPSQPRTVTPRTSSRISLRKGADGGVSRSASPAPAAPAHTHTTSTSTSSSTDASGETAAISGATNPGAGSWGWGSVWSSASAAVKQARSVVDEQVKNLPKNEQAKKWSEGMLDYVKNAQLDKIGQDLKSVSLSTFTDILNVVAPPISEHEVIQVWLSHDMRGYDGVESLVYQALTKVMEQVQGGDLVVNRGNESRPKDIENGPQRDLGMVEGFHAAYKLAKANIDELITTNAGKAPARNSTTSNPTTYSTVYLRIQPYLTSIPPDLLSTHDDTPSGSALSQTPTHLQFLLYLSSPSHSLTHTTTSQAVPSRWVDAFQEEDAEGVGALNSWVEDVLVDVLRVSVEIIGQEYVGERMGWGKRMDNTHTDEGMKVPPESTPSIIKTEV
ncbi:hypothetical protein K439DRAFT_1401418 [Ramaria rubella]|nr:hypothetical protein K439DRAFT_1401418 [Ramaria rubella]